VALVSQDPGHRVEFGVRDIDPVAIGTGWVAIDGQHGLVFERKSATYPGDVGALDHRPAREVPGGAPVSGGPEDVNGAGTVEVRRIRRSTLEPLAGEIGVAPSVEGDGSVTARLPVLPGRRPERGSPGEVVG